MLDPFNMDTHSDDAIEAAGPDSYLLEEVRIVWQEWSANLRFQYQLVGVTITAIAAVVAAFNFFTQISSETLSALATIFFTVLAVAILGAHVRTNHTCLYMRNELVPRIQRLHGGGMLRWFEEGMILRSHPGRRPTGGEISFSSTLVYMMGIWGIAILPGLLCLALTIYQATSLASPPRGQQGALLAVAIMLPGVVMSLGLAAVIPQAVGAYGDRRTPPFEGYPLGILVTSPGWDSVLFVSLADIGALIVGWIPLVFAAGSSGITWIHPWWAAVTPLVAGILTAIAVVAAVRMLGERRATRHGGLGMQDVRSGWVGANRASSPAHTELRGEHRDRASTRRRVLWISAALVLLAYASWVVLMLT